MEIRDSIPLGPLSEAFYYIDEDSCPQNSYCCMTFRGRPDVPAVREAVRRTQKQFPTLISRLTLLKTGARHLLARTPMAPPPDLTVHETPLNETDGDYSQALARHFDPYIARRIDLFHQTATRFELVPFSDGVHALVLLFHHIAADAGTIMSIWQTLFAAYDELVVGQAPDWADAETMPSSANPHKSPMRLALSIREMISESRLHARHPIIRFGRNERPTTPGRYAVDRIFTEDETNAFIANAKAKGLTVNDLLSVSCIRVVDEMTDFQEGTNSFWIPVNIRGRGTVADANHTSSINVELIREERIEESNLVMNFLAKRDRQFALGRQYANWHFLSRLIGFASYFPLEKRSPVLKKMLERPKTFSVSNVGVQWPLRIDGRLTPQSYLTSAGGLELMDYSINLAADLMIGHTLFAWTYNGRFKMNFCVYEKCLDRATAEKFLAKVSEKMLN